jgi:protoporphyrinogen oxidase
MKIAIVGAGISGLSLANILQPSHKVVVFEKQFLAGGLIKCERINDCLFHKVGGHVFNSKNQKVLEWFWSFFNRENEFVLAKRNAGIFIDQKIIGYPIENNLYELERSTVGKIIGELIDLQKEDYKDPLEYESFEVFLRLNFGNTLYGLYFKPYNQKLWNTDLSTISMKWLEGKLPMPDFKKIIVSNITREEESNTVHSFFYYPKENGSQFIINRLKEKLEIRINNTVSTIEKKQNKISIHNELFDKLIYCGDIRQMPEYCDKILSSSGVNIEYLKSLRSNGTSNLFCETDPTDLSWMYIPGNFTKAHRIIYTGNFSETNNRGSKRKTCVVEFSGKVGYDTMKNDIGQLPGNLQPLAYNYEPASYVIQDERTRTEINAAKRALRKENIFLLGRFAEWEYYNMDKAIESAMALASEM